MAPFYNRAGSGEGEKMKTSSIPTLSPPHPRVDTDSPTHLFHPPSVQVIRSQITDNKFVKLTHTQVTHYECIGYYPAY